jgi:hypothetical protein
MTVLESNTMLKNPALDWILLNQLRKNSRCHPGGVDAVGGVKRCGESVQRTGSFEGTAASLREAGTRLRMTAYEFCMTYFKRRKPPDNRRLVP